jgi:hypothetical protein
MSEIIIMERMRLKYNNRGLNNQNTITFSVMAIQLNNFWSENCVYRDEKFKLYGEMVNLNDVNLNILDIDKSKLNHSNKKKQILGLTLIITKYIVNHLISFRAIGKKEKKLLSLKIKIVLYSNYIKT